jgi:hypothetical protein
VEQPSVSPVTLDIRSSLCFPEGGVGPRNYAPVRASVHVPETSVNEYDLGKSHEHEVGLAGKIGPVKAISVTHCMHSSPYDHFRLGIAAPDRRHVAVTLLWCEHINHQCALLFLTLSKKDSTVRIPIG